MSDYEKTILPNGLRVIKVPMFHLHSAVAAIYVKAGPRFEPRDRNGIPHFAEHMLFKGTPSHPDPVSISQALAGIGADVNGSTMAEYSEVTLTAHSQHFIEGLDILADMIIRPQFAPVQIERERPVILNEMARDHDDAGEMTDIDELSYALMWPETSYSFCCLGSPDIVKTCTRDDLWGHYQKHYTPGNMVLCITGNYGEAGDIDAHVAELFGSFERPLHRPAAPPPDPQYRPLCFFKNAHTQTVMLKFSHKACAYRDPDLHATFVINDILGGGVSSRLFSILREDRSLVYDISSAPTLFSDVGLIDIITSTTTDSVAPTVDAMIDVTQSLCDGVDERELETYKQRVACHMDILLDNPVDMSEWYGVRELLVEPDELETPEQEAARLRAVTPDDIVRVSRGMFAADGRSLVVLGPCGRGQRRRIRKSLDL